MFVQTTPRHLEDARDKLAEIELERELVIALRGLVFQLHAAVRGTCAELARYDTPG